MSQASGTDADAGWFSIARRIPSPNFDERPADTAICLVVVHAISLPPGEFGGQGIVDLFTNAIDPQVHPYYLGIAGLRVSTHFLIRRDGDLIQFVSAARRAWHAGISQWAGRERCNDFSIGIELEGGDEMPFENAQYRMLNFLLAELWLRYPLQAVVGHSEIAPGRKTDPGPSFDWSKVTPPIAKVTG